MNINGEILTDTNQAKISIFDRGFLYGDSIYEVTDSCEDRLIFIDEHLDRLFESARKIFMTIKMSREEIIDQIQKTLKVLNSSRAYIRIIITRGEGEITLDPTKSTTNNFILICKKLEKNPKSWLENGVSVVIADTKRNSTESVDPSIKSGNYLNNILAYQEAVSKGVFDAIMLNHDDNVTEATTSNIWIVKNSVFITPPLGAGILNGITRTKLINLCHLNHYQFIEKNINALELMEADEVFLTSSTRRIVPVVRVNDRIIGSGKPGKQTIDFYNAYMEHFKLPY